MTARDVYECDRCDLRADGVYRFGRNNPPEGWATLVNHDEENGFRKHLCPKCHASYQRWWAEGSQR